MNDALADADDLTTTRNSTYLVALRHPRCAIVVAVRQTPIFGAGDEAPLDEQIAEAVESGCGLETANNRDCRR